MCKPTAQKKNAFRRFIAIVNRKVVFHDFFLCIIDFVFYVERPVFAHEKSVKQL